MKISGTITSTGYPVPFSLADNRLVGREIRPWNDNLSGVGEGGWGVGVKWKSERREIVGRIVQCDSKISIVTSE